MSSVACVLLLVKGTLWVMIAVSPSRLRVREGSTPGLSVSSLACATCCSLLMLCLSCASPSSSRSSMSSMSDKQPCSRQDQIPRLHIDPVQGSVIQSFTEADQLVSAGVQAQAGRSMFHACALKITMMIHLTWMSPSLNLARALM